MWGYPRYEQFNGRCGPGEQEDRMKFKKWMKELCGAMNAIAEEHEIGEVDLEIDARGSYALFTLRDDEKDVRSAVVSVGPEIDGELLIEAKLTDRPPADDDDEEEDGDSESSEESDDDEEDDDEPANEPDDDDGVRMSADPALLLGLLKYG